MAAVNLQQKSYLFKSVPIFPAILRTYAPPFPIIHQILYRGTCGGIAPIIPRGTRLQRSEILENSYAYIGSR